VSTAPPDFVGIGTHLAGTRWWFQLLREHPGIAGPIGGDESLRFFDRFCVEPMTDADVAEYHARFPAPGTALRGEWTPRYVYDAWTPPLLRRAAPDARLLVLLSDPIERYRLSLAYRTLDEGEGSAAYMTDVVHRGRYASQLRALYAAFPPEQVLVLQLEACRADPVGEYRRTLAFIGADPAYVPRRLRRAARGRTGPTPLVRAVRAIGVPRAISLRGPRRRVRQALGREEPIVVRAETWPDLRRSLHVALAPEIERLAAVAPTVDLELWPNFRSPSAQEAAVAAEQATERVLRRWRRRALAGWVAVASGGGIAVLAQFTDVI
jgi:hypothetical protein